jgi:hypothetical protein
MEKKIIGYVAPFDLWGGQIKKGSIYIPNFPNNYGYIDNMIEQFNIAQEIVETWEPVYEPEFKVGDFVWIAYSGQFCSGVRPSSEEKVAQIKHISTKPNEYMDSDGKIAISNCYRKFITVQIVGEKEYSLFAANKNTEYIIRLATPEEIKAAEIIKIGEYTVHIISNTCVYINDINYYKTEIISLINLMKKGQIKSLNVGCNSQYQVDLPLLEKILSKF